MKKITLALLILLLVGTFGLTLALQERNTIRSRAAAVGNATVDFSTLIMTLPQGAFSGTISTYGSTGNINVSAKQRAALKSLGLSIYRVPLQWNGGNVVSSAGGHPAGSGDDWIKNIRAVGGIPMIVIGGSADNNYTPAEAASLVDHFNGKGGTKATKVIYWVVGNEPDNQSTPMSQTCDLFNRTYDAMKAVDPNIKVAGPALASYDVGSNKAEEYREFLRCSGSRVDIVDFHDYGADSKDAAKNVQENTAIYEDRIKALRADIQTIVPARANQIEIQLGEYNMSAFGHGDNDPRFYAGATTVFGALVSGHVARAGGRSHQYSDQNNPLGLTFENQGVASQFGKTVADPLPIYHGIGMFTGEGLFRKFGMQMVQTSTTLPNVEIFASTNDKNIVVINKDPAATQNIAINLNGYPGGMVDVWQTNKDKPFDAPVKKTPLSVGSQIAYALPPYSVTTFVLFGGGTTVIPEITDVSVPTTPLSPTFAAINDCTVNGTCPTIGPGVSVNPSVVVPTATNLEEPIASVSPVITDVPSTDDTPDPERRGLVQKLLQLLTQLIDLLLSMFR